MASIKSGATNDVWTVDPTSKAGRVTLYDSLGNEIGSTLTGSVRGINTAIQQNVVADANNSSAANINAGATWTGTSTSTLGIVGIQINTYLNQQHTVTVEQSMDNSNWDITDSWDVPSNIGEGRTVQATASYLRVKVKNNTASTATVVRIQTALCPIVEAVPRSLTAGGNLKVTVAAEWQGKVLGLYAASSFRTLGAASSPQNLFTLENPSASTVHVAVRDISIMTDSTAALTSVAQQAILSRPGSLPTGGTVLTSVKYKTSYASATAIARGGTASDGGVATAITATAGTSIWQQFIDRPHTVVGWMTHPNYRMVPDVGTDLRQQILAPGESVLVQVVTSVPATTHMIVNAAWTETQYL